MVRVRMTLCLLLALTLLAAVPASVGEAPSILADEGKDESGNGDEKGNGVVEPAAPYRVEVECAFDAAAGQTTCAFTGVAPPGAKDVSHVDLPAKEVCAEVGGGDAEYVNPDPNTRVVGYKSRGSEGTFTLVMAGEVTPGGTATYWFKTGDGVFPAPGPGLVCGETEPQATFVLEPLPTAEATPPGAIVVRTYACGAAPVDLAAFDWYGECEPGLDGVPFALSLTEGTQHTEVDDGATDPDGVLRFEALAPGTYHLAGVDVVWCHAESDNVDERGELVVAAGAEVTVWIFLCGEAATK